MSKIEEKRHSLAHLLAAAVLELYPGTKNTIGPAIENGFYYDFEFISPISDSELKGIEKKMKKLSNSWSTFEKREVSIDVAKQIYQENPYKLELIEEIASKGETITLYTSGGFTDLCRGGHIEDMKEIDNDSWKLSRIAGAYWRGNEKNKMLTRIYGLAFDTKEELEAYEKQQEEAEKRDHRKLGKQMDLFTFSPLIGSGLPLYTPHGALIRKLLNEYIESLQTTAGYMQVWTPQIAKAELFKISGHYDKYKDDMFLVHSHYSDEEFFLKPMNCPQHTQIYASRMRSYRDLPLRYTDFAMLYRDEQPGQLSGLARVRSFSQDDCHIFCREDQVDEEIDVALNMIKEVMKTFGFSYRYRLSTRDPEHPEKYLGDSAIWDKAEKWAEEIMKRNKIEYFEGPGEASFYAPKMDLMVKDAIGREWQLSTVQIDFVQPARFGLTYNDKDGQLKTPVMIHRAILGSVERMMMILIEHYAGAFPLWLAPVQVKILPIGEGHFLYATEVMDALKAANIRVEYDASDETLGKKIRNAKTEKVPYILVIGDKEVSEKTVTVESRDRGNLGAINPDDLVTRLKEEIRERK